MCSRVVAKTNLLNSHSGSGCGLINSSTVATTVLANVHHRVVTIPLVKRCAVTETILSQTN